MRVLFIIILFSCVKAIGQVPLDDGFKLLDSGELQASAIFFEKVLVDEPNNKNPLD